MKKLHKITALLLAALCIISITSCRASDNEDSEVTEQTSIEESSEPSSTPEPSKAESSKKVSSKPSKPSKQESKEEVIVDSSREILSDFTGLLAENSDTVGWVNVPNTPIDYVVVQSPKDLIDTAYEQDPYYLQKDFYGNYYYPGSIFMDYRSEIGCKNMILHGHSMANGTMFAGLLNFSDLGVYKSSPVLSFNTLYEKSKWKIIAVIKVNTLEYHGPIFRYLRGHFGSDYDFLNFVYELRMRSIIDCPVDVNENDQLVTLSTCAYDFDSFRLAVIARKVREGESSAVKVSDARYNPNPLYPDIWYNCFGGTKPEVTSFQDALNSKKIKWYDGKKKWSKKDDDELAKLLQSYKNKAEKTIRDSYNESDYTQDQISEINTIIGIYLPYVADATDITRVMDLCKQCTAIIKTYLPERKKLEDEEKARQTALKTARAAAINEIESAAKSRKFSAHNQEKVRELIQTYKKKINECQDPAMIPVMRDNAVSRIDKLKSG